MHPYKPVLMQVEVYLKPYSQYEVAHSTQIN